MPRITKLRFPETERPTVVGSGLLALDIVLSEVSGAPARFWAGGTLGNVLIILSYLGWDARPVARLGRGAAAERILADLDRWRVSREFVSITDDGSTPIIVERISQGRGSVPKHSFSWRCPECGAQLPTFKAVLASVAEDLASVLPGVEVYFFDRATPGGIVLAKACADRGALVVFEPSSVGNPVLFRQAWEVSHVVKYSHERLRELPEVEVEGIPRLQVETLGEAGLRYRRVSENGRADRWVETKAFSVESIRDAAGSGDWCTAGFIDRAGRGGSAGFHIMSDAELFEAFKYGQALAAWNCNFEGARGGMYAVERADFLFHVQEILGGHIEPASHRLSPPDDENAIIGIICPACLRADTERLATGTSGAG